MNWNENYKAKQRAINICCRDCKTCFYVHEWTFIEVKQVLKNLKKNYVYFLFITTLVKITRTIEVQIDVSDLQHSTLTDTLPAFRFNI